MDVRCDRCGTEYEFDDALVSERGTSVKCTNCGHQFKVFRGKGDAAPPEQWVIRTYDGREVVFITLRELKTAIMARQVLRSDRLARGGGPIRTLGSIPELTSFFDEAERVAREGASARVPTPRGLGGPTSQVPLTSDRVVARTLQGLAPAPHQTTGQTAVPVMLPPLAEPPPPASVEPPTARRGPPGGISAPPGLLPPLTTTSGAINDITSRDEVSFRGERSQFVDDDTSLGRPRNAGSLRWVLALVVLGGLGVVGVTYGKQLIGEGPKAAATTGAQSEQVKGLLQQSDRALAEGDIEGARELLGKASALAENDVRVQVSLSRLWATRADVAWLKLKLIKASDPGAADARAVAQRDLKDATDRARKAADHAAELSADDLAVVRVKVDALRLADDLAVARALAPRLASGTLQPETAYVLAALDLAEASPPWKGIIERLQLAASAESAPGRARAALVYALASSGASSAKQEFERMVSATRPYPLVPELRRLVEGGAGAAPSASGASIDIAALPSAPVAPVPTYVPPSGVTAPTTTAVAPPPTGTVVIGEGRRPGGEFSEDALKKQLPANGTTTVTKPDGPKPDAPKPDAPKPDEKKPDEPKPDAPKKPHIDTSDLPGVTPP